MLISRAELKTAFQLKTLSLDFKTTTEPLDAQHILGIFQGNEDNKKLLGLYEKTGYKLACYCSRTADEAYIILSPKFSASRVFKMADLKNGNVKEIYDGELPIIKLAKLADNLDEKEKIAGELDSIVNRLVNERVVFPPRGTSPSGHEKDTLSELNFLETQGSPELAQLVREAWAARDAGQSIAPMLRNIGREIIKIARDNENRLPKDIEKIEAGFNIAKL